MGKNFLTYNQQMKHLRNQKKILCEGSDDKKVLCRAGYFNLVNGYKTPFTNGKDSKGNHIYLPDTSIQHLNDLKEFDDELRILLLKYITKAEEEIRAFAAYKFDEANRNGSIAWYQVSAFNVDQDIRRVIGFISKAYAEIGRSKLEYIQFYMDTHKNIPTWIVTKVINFSTFIDFVQYSKMDVKNALCELYGIVDDKGIYDHKLLIGSLHWMRKVRNVCAHNERLYTIKRDKGRIINMYINLLPKSYKRESNQKLIDLLIYLKYYLESADYECLITNIKDELTALKEKISINAFERVRAEMGIKDISHLDILLADPKNIEYNKF